MPATESPDKHYMLDNKQLVIIPARDLVAKISQVYTAFDANSKSGQKLEPFEKVGLPQPHCDTNANQLASFFRYLPRVGHTKCSP
jgi:hypothetical protein